MACLALTDQAVAGQNMTARDLAQPPVPNYSNIAVRQARYIRKRLMGRHVEIRTVLSRWAGVVLVFSGVRRVEGGGAEGNDTARNQAHNISILRGAENKGKTTCMPGAHGAILSSHTKKPGNN